jgi:hypothetical protein
MSQPRADIRPFETEQYLKDLATTAGLIKAPCNPEMCQRVVSTFESDFHRHVLQWKTTDRPGDGLFYRFLSTDREDLVAKSMAADLLTTTNKPLLELQREALETFPQAVRSGVDFEAVHGLSKVWTYTTPLPLPEVLRLKNLPEAVRANESELKEAGLDLVGFLASDFISETMNVYFAWHPEQRNRAWLQSMLERSRDTGPSKGTFQDMIESQDEISGIGMTFDWTSQVPLRWCVYCFAVPFGHREPGVRVPQLPERLRKLRDEAPSLNYHPGCHMAWSYGPAGPYIKLEKNYAKDVDHFLATERSLVFRAALQS